jgi:hypothetical protein
LLESAKRGNPSTKKVYKTNPQLGRIRTRIHKF